MPLLTSFPPGIAVAFAYGSGVFDQPGLYEDGAKQAMLDVIFAVEHPIAWHQQNIARHRHHYSLFGAWGGAHAIQSACTLLDAPVYFNTLVAHMLPHDRLLKYGVVSLETLQHDLHTWQHMYIAGRMHKPVRWLTGEERVQDAQVANVRAACATALLLLMARKQQGGGTGTAAHIPITQQEFLSMLVGLSYAGDVRMGIAEDSNKVQRIVQGSGAGLTDMYQPYLDHLTAHRVLSPLDPNTPTSPAYHLHPAAASAILPTWLPATLQHTPLQSLAAALAARVGRSSRQQALLGVLSAGVGKSLQYAASKVYKAWRR